MTDAFEVTMTRLAMDLLREADEDYVGFWVLLANVRRIPELCEGRDEKDVVLDLAGRLIEGGAATGEFATASKRFVRWGTPPEVAMSRIAEEWKSLGHDPIGGEVVWFTRLPEQG